MNTLKTATTDPTSGQPASETQKRRGPLRRLYSWVLSWADSRFGTVALFVISFAESSFFPIPPDVLQVALSVSRPRRAFYYAAVSAVASVLGAIVGYYIGYAFWAALGDFFYSYVPGVSEDKVQYVGSLYQEHAFLSITAAAFTPIPFKVFTIAAGIFHQYVPLQTLLVASAVGRGARFLLVALAIFLFGEKVRGLLEKHLELITIALFALIVLGFAAIKFMMH